MSDRKKSWIVLSRNGTQVMMSQVSSVTAREALNTVTEELENLHGCRGHLTVLFVGHGRFGDNQLEEAFSSDEDDGQNQI